MISPKTDLFNKKDTTLHTKSEKNYKGRGTALFVNNHLNCKLRDKFSINREDIEILSITQWNLPVADIPNNGHALNRGQNV